MKPPSTARTAGRSDWAERRFRRQPFILLSFSSSKKLRKAQETQSYQRIQHIVHTVFNTSGTNAPRGETGASPPSATAQSCATSEITLYAVFVTPDSATLLYTYISRFSVNPHYQQQFYLRPSFIAFFNLSHKRPTFAFTSESGYTLGFRRRIAHSGLHAETGGVSDGGGITTLRAFRTFTNIPGPGIRTAYFAAFGAWSWVLPKNAESLRDSDALMRVAVPRRRGPAGLRDLFRFCRNRDLYIRRSWFSACARWGWYYYPRRALRAAETLDGRLSKRLTCRFLALPDSSLIPAAQNIVPFLYRCQKDQRDTRWSFHFCSHLLTCPDRPDRGT